MLTVSEKTSFLLKLSTFNQARILTNGPEEMAAMLPPESRCPSRILYSTLDCVSTCVDNLPNISNLLISINFKSIIDQSILFLSRNSFTSIHCVQTRERYQTAGLSIRSSVQCHSFSKQINDDSYKNNTSNDCYNNKHDEY